MIKITRDCFYHWEVWMRGNNLLTSSLLSLGKNIFFTPPPFFAAFFFYQSNSHEFPLETVLWVIQELLAECFGNLDRLLDVPCCLISSIWILDWNQNLGISLQVLHGGQGWPRDLCDFDGQWRNFLYLWDCWANSDWIWVMSLLSTINFQATFSLGSGGWRWTSPDPSSLSWRSPAVSSGIHSLYLSLIIPLATRLV